jgi:hypothetical protein
VHREEWLPCVKAIWVRVYSDLEKGILRDIAYRERVNLFTLIDSALVGIGIRLDTVTNQVDVSIEVSNPEAPPPDVQERLDMIQELLVQAVNVIELFENRGYLFTYQTANVIPNPLTVGQLPVNSKSVGSTLPDRRISVLLCRYATQEIRAQLELAKFISDGFITREEVRANRQFRTTLAALIVAIIGLVANLTYTVVKDRRACVWAQEQHNFVPPCHGH